MTKQKTTQKEKSKTRDKNLKQNNLKKTKITPKKEEPENSRIELKSPHLPSKKYLPLVAFLTLLRSSLQACSAQDQNTGLGEILIWHHETSNNTLRTVDHFGVYRILDLATNNIQYELDLIPKINAALVVKGITATESYIRSGVFEILSPTHEKIVIFGIGAAYE